MHQLRRIAGKCVSQARHRYTEGFPKKVCLSWSKDKAYVFAGLQCRNPNSKTLQDFLRTSMSLREYAGVVSPVIDKSYLVGLPF